MPNEWHRERRPEVGSLPLWQAPPSTGTSTPDAYALSMPVAPHQASTASPRPSLLRPALFISVPLLVILGVILTPWIIANLRVPLSGDRSHDFGIVGVPREGVSLQHTFNLRNKTKRTLTIRAAKPSCSCVTLTYAPETLEPGQELKVETTLSFRAASAKNETITFDFGDDGRAILSLSAVGVRKP
jgi:hypothetical protein